MRKMNYVEPIIDGYNAIVGTAVAVLSYILGDFICGFLAFECGRLVDRVDEKPYSQEREFG